MTEERTWPALLADLTDQEVLGLTAWAEARGDWREGNSSLEERVAVMSVAVTRSRQRRESVRQVCLAPAQFSCWTRDLADRNHLALVEQVHLVLDRRPVDPLLDETLFLAFGVLTRKIQDRTGGSDHYYAPKGMKPVGRAPKWAIRADGTVLPPTAIVGEQHFYRLTKGPVV